MQSVKIDQTQESKKSYTIRQDSPSDSLHGDSLSRRSDGLEDVERIAGGIGDMKLHSVALKVA